MSLNQTTEAFIIFSTNRHDVGIVNNILYSCKVTCTLYTWRVIVVQCFNCMHCMYIYVFI